MFYVHTIAVVKVRGDCQPVGLPAATPYNPIVIIADVEGGGVTIWKTILSLFLMCGANHFEGVRWLR